MARYKMNTGLVTSSSFYAVALNSSSAPTSKMRELQAYMGLRQMALVPTLASGSGGGPEYYDPNLAEGKWVRDEPFVFDAANDSAVPVKPVVTGLPTNGDFSQLKGDGSPAAWQAGPDAAGAMRWSVDNASARAGGVRSMRCDIDTPIDCSRVPAGKACESGSLVSDHFAIDGGGVFQITFDLKVAPSTDLRGGDRPQITIVTTSASGEVATLASVFAVPTSTAPMTNWSRQRIALVTAPNATTMFIYSRVMVGAGSNTTATWWLSDFRVLRIDGSLRNIIRTNVSDVEVAANGKAFTRGEDFEVVSPAAENDAHKFDYDSLQPYVVRRLPAGRIPAAAAVNLSYDFLPGKVNVQGHSTPNAFAEPACGWPHIEHATLLATPCSDSLTVHRPAADYEFMERAINGTFRSFPGIKA